MIDRWACWAVDRLKFHLSKWFWRKWRWVVHLYLCQRSIQSRGKVGSFPGHWIPPFGYKPLTCKLIGPPPRCSRPCSIRWATCKGLKGRRRNWLNMITIYHIISCLPQYNLLWFLHCCCSLLKHTQRPPETHSSRHSAAARATTFSKPLHNTFDLRFSEPKGEH